MIASYAKDMEIVVFNGHVHTTEIFDVDGVKYLMLGGGGAEQDPILPGRTSIKLPGRLSARSLLEGPAAQEEYNYVLVDVNPARRPNSLSTASGPWSAEPFGTVELVQVDSVPRYSERARRGDHAAHRSWLGRGGAARRDHAPGLGDLGTGGRPARFVLRPLSHRAAGLIRQRHRRSVCVPRAPGRNPVSVLPRRHQAGFGARRPLASAWPVRHQGALRRHRAGAAAGLLGLLATAAADDSSPPRAALTTILAFIVWWSFLIGHVLNNIKGFGE